MWKTQSRTRQVRISNSPLGPVVAMKVARGLMGLLFALVVWGALASTWQAWRSHDYVAVQGTITDKSVSRSGRHVPGSANKHRPGHYLAVTYNYEVDGRRFDGDRIQAGTFGMISGDTLKRFAGRFEKGRAVTVYVDPQDPDRAVLEKGLSSIATLLYVLCGFFGCAWVVLDILVKGFSQPHPPLASANAAAATTKRPSAERRPLYSLAAPGPASVLRPEMGHHRH